MSFFLARSEGNWQETRRSKDWRRTFIRVVMVCFFVSAIVSGRGICADGPIDADGEIVACGSRKLGGPTADESHANRRRREALAWPA